MELPTIEIVEQNVSTERAQVNSFLSRLNEIVESSQSSEAAVSSLMNKANATVGFGPMFKALQALSM